jgi:hypothetical protein
MISVSGDSFKILSCLNRRPSPIERRGLSSHVKVLSPPIHLSNN